MFVGYAVLRDVEENGFKPIKIYKSPPFSKNICDDDSGSSLK